jgi:hypothetical protein
VKWQNPINGSRRKLTLTAGVFALACLLLGCSRVKTNAEPEPVPDAQIQLSALGLPKNFFSTRDEAPRTIIAYRFVVWLNSEEVVVGFNTSPVSRVSPISPMVMANSWLRARQRRAPVELFFSECSL